MEQIKTEVNILLKAAKSACSDSISKLVYHQETEKNFYMIMKFCNAGDLSSLLALRKRFTENEARSILS
jgi:serine/threonine protein kinase